MKSTLPTPVNPDPVLAERRLVSSSLMIQLEGNTYQLPGREPFLGLAHRTVSVLYRRSDPSRITVVIGTDEHEVEGGKAVDRLAPGERCPLGCSSLKVRTGFCSHYDRDGIERTPSTPSVTPPAACSVCGTMVAASTLTRDSSLGGEVCRLCSQQAETIRIRLSVAQGRQRQQLEEQLRRMVLDVRSGCDLPTFDQADFS